VLSNAGDQHPRSSPGSLTVVHPMSEVRDHSGPHGRLQAPHLGKIDQSRCCSSQDWWMRRFQVPPPINYCTLDKRPCAQMKETACPSVYFCVRKSNVKLGQWAGLERGCTKNRWRTTDQRWQFHGWISMSDWPLMIGHRCHQRHPGLDVELPLAAEGVCCLQPQPMANPTC
jgi:hypothetical protein